MENVNEMGFFQVVCTVVFIPILWLGSFVAANNTAGKNYKESVLSIIAFVFLTSFSHYLFFNVVTQINQWYSATEEGISQPEKPEYPDYITEVTHLRFICSGGVRWEYVMEETDEYRELKFYAHMDKYGNPVPCDGSDIWVGQFINFKVKK